LFTLGRSPVPFAIVMLGVAGESQESITAMPGPDDAFRVGELGAPTDDLKCPASAHNCCASAPRLEPRAATWTMGVDARQPPHFGRAL
jgi:hypothetical protein